ncbi:A/G-specific adenine glycosylase [Sphingobacterium faecale]|uniref:Adenine DNA glycosylase n=1 Tax=Sphingobacterium faecale TaxID=2803775 RepID=A0ABS1R4R4_9SPHI|nr:A/G-specific adenine glycosylase [Sphingobacterium faecale]MBL1409653.1 A/G-specific adenine glycosylase [Sphingobacterium faecale]
MSFASKLIIWYQSEGRDLPWRKTRDPYIIWLSEIILQQTRVEQGLPYFYTFREHFPTVLDFAEASEDELLRLWQGLGYYSRARNMHKTAKIVAYELKGEFPVDYDSLLRLPGIGEYTAAAISSFSVGESKAVLDGNVFRVLSRVFGISTAINSTEGKKLFQSLAQDLISTIDPGTYNHAIMDFGATVCKPKAPLCESCVFRGECAAFEEGSVALLPVKIKSKKSRDRYFNYFLVEEDGLVLMARRGGDDVWANMYEFPLLETREDLDLETLMRTDEYRFFFGSTVVEPIGGITKHVLSHQNIYARFFRLPDAKSVLEKKDTWHYFFLENLDKLAKHKLIFSFIDKYFKD